ncbi:MAG: hypothetical protein IPK16_22490 [Anaerolineales bacterium]|nr:hypothetical protein [Anaerolineales bacterium]
MTILLNLALVPILLLLMWLDPVAITGVNGWVKPLKFSLSIAVYTATFLWLLTLVQGRRRWVKLAANITAAGLMIEIVLITMQVARGTSSHFNVSTPFDAAVFSIMGAMISLVAVMNLLLAIWLLFQRMPDPVIAWGLRLGVLLSLTGIAVGVYMTSAPTPAQLAALQTGAALTNVGAHSVGVPDGGPGLPFLGWSTVGGDLRIGHFVGLHAMQLLPLVAFVLSRPGARRRFTQTQRLALVWTTGASYLGLTLLVTWQALRGQPLIAPDTTTLLAAAAWLGATLFAIALITLAPMPRTRSIQPNVVTMDN